MDATTPTVYLRRRSYLRTHTPVWTLHGRRDCPALLCVADTQIAVLAGTVPAVIDAYAGVAHSRGQSETVFLLCSCLTAPPDRRLPTAPPLHARITVQRDPDTTP